MAKAGMVEALYVAELVGLVLIWVGYMTCVRAPRLERVDRRATSSL